MKEFNLTLTKDEWETIRFALLDIAVKYNKKETDFLSDEAIDLYFKLSSLLVK